MLVGCADDAHVRADRVGAADALKLAVFDDPQNLLLHARRNRPELVEHERAAVRLLEAADVRARRTRERAGLMPEQLRLEQCLRERCAVDLDERLLPPRREKVQAGRDELFAGAAFADHEHGLHELGGARDVLEHGHESRCFADQTDVFGGRGRGSTGQEAPTVGRFGEILAQDQTQPQALITRASRIALAGQRVRGWPRALAWILL